MCSPTLIRRLGAETLKINHITDRAMAKKTQAGLSAVLPKEETIDPTHVSIDERIDRIIEKGVAAGKFNTDSSIGV